MVAIYSMSFPLNMVIIFLPFASRLAILGLQSAGTQYFEPKTTAWYRWLSSGYATAILILILILYLKHVINVP